MSDKFMKKLEELLEEQQGGATDPIRDFLTDHRNYKATKGYERPEVLKAIKDLQDHPDIDASSLTRDKRYTDLYFDVENGNPYRTDWFKVLRSLANSYRVEGADKFDIRPETYEDEETESSPVDSSVNKDNLEESFKNLQEAFSAFKVSLNEASVNEKQSYLKMLKELQDG